MSSDGQLEVFAGDAGMPVGIALGQSGDLYMAQRSDGKVVRVRKSGTRLTLLDRLKSPRDPAFDAAGNLLIAETETGRVLKLVGKY